MPTRPSSLHHCPSVPSVPVVVASAKSQGLQRSAAFCTLQPSLSRAEHWSCLKPVSPEAGFAWRGWCVCLSVCCSCSCSCSCPSNAAKPSVCALCATSLLLAAPPCRCAPFDQPLEGISDALAGSPSHRKTNGCQLCH